MLDSELPRLTERNLLNLDKLRQRESPAHKKEPQNDGDKIKHFGKLAIRLNLLGDANKSLEWKVEEKKSSTRQLALDHEALEADFD